MVDKQRRSRRGHRGGVWPREHIVHVWHVSNDRSLARGWPGSLHLFEGPRHAGPLRGRSVPDSKGRVKIALGGRHDQHQPERPPLGTDKVLTLSL
jgi:hypothetical protein